MNLLVVFNPKAAGGRASGMLDELKAALEHRGVNATFLTLSEELDLGRRLSEPDIRSFDGVVAAGGDGTGFAVLNGLLAHPQDLRSPLGLMPLGTGNAFSRDIGLEPGNWRQALDVVCAGRTRRVDVGEVHWSGGTYRFINILGLGLVVDAARAADRFKWLGSGAYTLGTAQVAMRAKSLDLRLVIDGEEVNEDSLLLEVANSRYTGTSYKIAPDARIDDGLLDVILVRKLTRRRLFRLFPSIYSGRHVEYPEVQVWQARDIEIRSPAGASLLVDGEIRGETPATIRCIPGAVRLFCA